MRFLRFDSHLLLLSLIVVALPAAAQDAQAPPPTPQPQVAIPQSQIPAGAAATPAPPAKPAVPDYPDPRTFTVGVFYWITGPGQQPSTVTGRLSTDYETLNDLGKPKGTPDIQLDIPISRTGELRFEGFLTKGDGNQVVGANPPFLFTTQFYTGDQLATQYQITGGKLYLDDLAWPHKFPVSKFRVHSLWEVQYLRIKSTIDAPLVLTGATATQTRQLVLPTFGLAPEYAIAPHVLFRVDGSGFGLYHKSDIWDAEATLSYRHNSWEIVGGAKALHFKTSPQKTDYYIGTLSGAYVGFRWHL